MNSLRFFIVLLSLVSGHAQVTKEGFQIPQADNVLTFPKDHGSHPEYKIEWWYLTGHLYDEANKRFGFQATFFRLGQRPRRDQDAAKAAFGSDQIYMAHMAVVDVSNKRYHHEERLNRGGWDAHAKVGDLDLRNGNWTLKRQPDDSIALSGSIRADVSVQLRLTPSKPLVRFGEDGLSRKSADAAASSYYLTFPRLKAQGALRIDGRDYNVHGQAWMDHEISSGQLARDQIGWDWVSMQLNDGREIMAFILRTETGEADAFSSLTWVTKSGETASKSKDEFAWEYQGHWTSRHSRAVYPIAPLIRTTDPDTGNPISFKLRPVIEDQELIGKLTGISYWEGACDVLDGGGEVIGVAYLELTGYSKGLTDYLGAE